MRQALAHGTPDNTTIKFAVCNEVEGNASLAHVVEDSEEGDMLMLTCKEGWKKGLLTRKLIAAMYEYKKGYAADHKFFMRVDDDTFVAWHRVRKALEARDHGTGTLFYLGAMVPAGRIVNRDKSSPWYQPTEAFKPHTYPVYMQKGPGYLLSREIVLGALAPNVSQAYVLSNEDQAMGVWVDLLRRQGMKIKHHSLPNLEGHYSADVSWQEYPAVLHHNLKGDYIACLGAMDARSDGSQRLTDCFTDSMFVAIFSARSKDSRERREHVRTMFMNADSGMGRFVPKFILCNQSDNLSSEAAATAADAELQQEALAHGDMLFLGCTEGYGRTLLTRKLLLALQAYRDKFGEMTLFMKIDDDTFVSWRRLKKFLAAQWGTSNAYMGIPAPEGFKVNRNPSSPWYQPRDGYPNETYPITMEGGPGYIIGGELVRRILSDWIAANHILSNEDQAAGVWIDILKQRGMHVNYITLPGTDGYRPQFDTCFGPWKDYPFLLHHHLKPQVVSCLARLDNLNNDNATIDSCFDDCVRYTTIALTSKVDVLSQEVRKALTKLMNLDTELQEMTRVGQWLSKQVGEDV